MVSEETKSSPEEEFRHQGQMFFMGSWVQNEIRDLRQEIKAVENNLRQEIKAVETNLRREIKAVEDNVRQEIKQEVSGLRQEIKTVETSLRQEMKGFFWAIVGIALASLAVSISVAVKIWQ